MAATYRVTFDANSKPTRIKDDFAAASAPDANDDFATGGWRIGSLQYVPTTDTLYIAESVGTGAAVWVVVGAAASLAAHLSDASDAHDASAISFTPNGSIAATDVQAAIQEVRDEATAGGHYEVLMTPGISNPPEPFETPDGEDWFYAWVPDA